MSWQRALSAPLNEDLSGFSRLLQAQQIGHRLSETGGVQQLWVADVATVAQVQQLYQHYQSLPAHNL